MPITTEAILTSPNGFGLTTASPLQRAICRVKDGLPLGDLSEHPAVIEAFGGQHAVAELHRMAGHRPSEFLIIAGVRTFKSVFAAASIVELSQNVDCRRLSVGDIVRVPVFSLRMKIRAVMNHLVENLQAKPLLRALIVGDPLAESVTLTRRGGRHIIVERVPIGAKGGAMISDWHAGQVGDEVPRMVGEEDGDRNFDEMRRAGSGRRLPGAQAIWIGSPHAPFGPIYDLVQEYHGKPTPDLVVVRGTGPALNPVTWTPQECAAVQRRDPKAYWTDVLGNFADPEESLISSVELDAVTRAAPLTLPSAPSHSYVAAMDPATRGNAWTLIVGTRDAADRFVVVLSKQWIGSKQSPLSPEAVMTEIRRILAPYRCTHVLTDRWATDAIKDIGKRMGLFVIERMWTEADRLERYMALRLAIADRHVELSPDVQLRADLLSIRKRVTQQGWNIVLPQTADGRHADYAPALTLAHSEYAARPGAPLPDEGERIIQGIIERAERRGNNPYDALEREFGMEDITW